MMFDPRQGRVVSNWETLGAVATKAFTVPAGKIWEFMGFGYVERDVNATLNIKITDGTNDICFIIAQIAAGVTNISLPEDLATGDKQAWMILKSILLPAGWTITVMWGVAQTTPEVAMVVREYDI